MILVRFPDSSKTTIVNCTLKEQIERKIADIENQLRWVSIEGEMRKGSPIDAFMIKTIGMPDPVSGAASSATPVSATPSSAPATVLASSPPRSRDEQVDIPYPELVHPGRHITGAAAGWDARIR